MNDKSKGLKENSVRHGTQTHTEAGAIGGVDSEYGADGRPLVVLSLNPKGGSSGRVDLYEGDTFELGPEQWQVTEIVSPNTDRWVAVLTQLR